MQIKNKIIIYFLALFLFSSNLYAEEFNISAEEILIDKENEILTGKGSVKAIDSEERIVTADKIIYQKSKEFLTAVNNAKVVDNKGNVLIADKITYDKLNEIIVTYQNSELILDGGYKLVSKNITYNILDKIVRSNHNSIFTDGDGNIIETEMFQYDTKNNLFSSLGKIKITDEIRNEYFFKELHVDTKNKEMIGSDVSVLLDQKNFGMSEESDPRFVANDIIVSKNISKLSKAVFTSCKKREGKKCPPWSLKAKEISHDKIKKTIYYKKATLKIYDIPIFYFPKFFHPDPTVKRQSGFLIPLFTNSTSVGTGFGLPYYWAIGDDRDLTFTPKLYTKSNVLMLNEYRQAFRNNSFLTLDTSYTKGYKDTSPSKPSGSKDHIFAELDLNFDKDESNQNSLSIKIQRTSDRTYFRKHNINTSLVKAENTNLENQIKYSLAKEDMYLDVATNVYQNLREKNKSNQYEYIVPNIMFGKTFLTKNYGIIDFSANALHSKYETNRQKTFLTNDLIWSPASFISKKGFVNAFQGMLRNTNYETRKTKEYKDGDAINELSGVLSYKTSLPLKKEGVNFTNLFTPNFMVRYAPGHMRNLNCSGCTGANTTLNYTNLYSLNKTSEIEDGLSLILGFGYKNNEKREDNSTREKLSLSVGQIFNYETNKDIPTKSSLDQKMSDVVGEINYNFSEIGNIDYKFSLDHNLNDLNYNEISTVLNFGKIEFNLDYLEEQNHRGNEHYASSGITLNFNENNKLSFSTKKNFKTESTELYDLNYQYGIDCLTAGLVYRREFYQDSDLEPKNTLMFTVTFVPFANVNTPPLNQ